MGNKIAKSPLTAAGRPSRAVERPDCDSLHLFEILAQHSRDFILLVRLEDGRILEANAAAVTAYGFSRDELLELTIHDLRAPETHEMVARQMGEADSAGILFETVHRRKDGRTFPVEVSSQGTALGGVRVLVSIIRDITERRHVEDSLRASEAKYRLLFENMADGFAVYELLYDGQGIPVDWRILEVNDAYLRLTGLSRDRIAGRPISQLFPSAIPEYLPRFAEVVTTQKAIEFETFSRHVSRYFKVVTFPAGSNRFASTISDISARKEAEKALRDYELKASALINVADESIWLFDLEGRILAVNATGAMRLGRTVDELVGKKWPELLPPDLARSRAARIDEILRTGDLVNFEDERGGITFEHRAYPVRDEAGTITSLAFFSRDVTESKLAERKLLERSAELEDANARLDGERHLLESVIEALPIGIAVTNADGGTIHSNITFEKLWGGERPRTLSIEDYSAYRAWWADTGRRVAPDEWASAVAVRSGESVIGQLLRIQRFDGSEKYVLNSASPVRNADGNLYGCVVAIQDVSELKRSEDALRKSEELLSFHMENSPMAVIQWDRDFIVTRWTGDAERIFGWSAEDTVGKVITDLNIVFEEDLPIVAHTVAQLIDGVTRQVVSTNRNYTKNGAIRHCTWFNSVQFDQQGRMNSVLSKVIDVTDRVKAEERLDLLAESANLLLVSESPQDVVDRICMKALAVLDSQVFLNYLLDDKEERLHLNACSGISPDERQKIEWLDFAIDGHGCGDCGACRIQAERIPDSSDPRSELVNSHGLKEFVCHPLLAQDRVLGTLSFGTRSRNYSEDDLSLMKAVADQIAIAIDRMHVAAALYQSNEELERRVSERTMELNSTVGILQEEIWDRVVAEISLKRLNRLYAVLTETNQAIVRVRNRDEIFRDFCRIAVEHGGFLLAWVGLVDDVSGEVRIAAASGATGYLENIRITADEKEPEGCGSTGTAIRQGTFNVCNDFQMAVNSRPWLERGVAFGFNASAAVAFMEDGRVVGALTLYAGEKDFFDQLHVELLMQIGSDISFALDNLRREENRKKVEQILMEETLQRLQAVEALRRQEHLMIQQNRHAAMGEMIGNIAHQWRQPLNTLGLFIQRLGIFYDSPDFTREFVDMTVSKSMEMIHYMSRTIDDFRSFFSTDRVRMEFRVDEAVDRALSLVDASFKERRIVLERDGSENVAVCGFPNEYAQVLLNILINAKDAIDERKVEFPRIKVSIGTDKGVSVVTIADNAGGIPEDIIGKIFDPYFTTKGPQQGTGVGLFMSKSIIENNMGGRLSVRNTDTGAEFRIEV